jgi:hypothetical protein
MLLPADASASRGQGLQRLCAQPWRIDPVRQSALNPIGAGSNGSCSPLYLCTAGHGYSGPAGVGSPKGIAAF